MFLLGLYESLKIRHCRCHGFVCCGFVLPPDDVALSESSGIVHFGNVMLEFCCVIDNYVFCVEPCLLSVERLSEGGDMRFLIPWLCIFLPWLPDRCRVEGASDVFKVVNVLLWA